MMITSTNPIWCNGLIGSFLSFRLSMGNFFLLIIFTFINQISFFLDNIVDHFTVVTMTRQRNSRIFDDLLIRRNTTAKKRGLFVNNFYFMIHFSLSWKASWIIWPIQSVEREHFFWHFILYHILYQLRENTNYRLLFFIL